MSKHDEARRAFLIGAAVGAGVWRFFERHNVTVKKKPARDGARTGGRGAGAAALDSQARPA